MNDRANMGSSSTQKECTRITVGLIGVVFVLVAIFLMWLGIESNYNAELNLLGLHKQASYTCMVLGVALFATASLGWTAVATKSECLSFGFGYLAMTTFLVCTALGVSIHVEKSLLLSQLNEGCQLKSGMIYELDQIFETGQGILCSEKCPCNADSGIYSTEVAELMVTDPLGATRLDQCRYETNFVSVAQRVKYYPMLEILETDFECAGFCSEGKYYLFSDVRNGVPKNGSCKEEIVESVNSNAGPYALVLIILGAIGFVGMSMSFVICNMAKQKLKGEQLYNYAKYGVSKDD